MALFLGEDRNVMIELCLVERPYQLLWRLCNRNLGGPRLAEVAYFLCQVRKLVRHHRSHYHDYLFPFRLLGGATAAAFRTRAADAGCLRKSVSLSSLASISSSFISTFVRRSARLMTSAREGMFSCCSAWSIVFSMISRNGEDTER